MSSLQNENQPYASFSSNFFHYFFFYSNYIFSKKGKPSSTVNLKFSLCQSLLIFTT